jgi:molybdopterin-binding protein
MPPRIVVGAGLSEIAIHTQSGARTTSSRVINATSAAGISLAPMRS